MSAAPHTLTALFFDAVQTYGARAAAFRYKADGVWRDVTHQEAAARVQALSLGLRELGLVAGEKVAILAETRLEWALTDTRLSPPIRWNTFCGTPERRRCSARPPPRWRRSAPCAAGCRQSGT